MNTDATRLAELLQSPDCVHYCQGAPLSGKVERQISIHANCRTGETFVVVADDQGTRVKSFFSRHKCCPPEDRRKGISLVDLADAFALARVMSRNWPHGRHRKPAARRPTHRRTARTNP
ncbi:hypothetical protein [Opitutus sp. GAS368]|uniref:hypothetical protein n=1 Tax=Opitutus sp. GAS368 TaxID=1882749 RepID=UPI00087DAB66|nr:hypothetical protein [Opitutus sp. GAS368]SDS05072.1 hypothetical protein SAMN05444173_1739 [Opitutus sp. GAS368]